MELEHTKHFVGLSRHFTAMSTVVIVLLIVEVMSLLHATNDILKFSFLSVRFITVCRLLLVK
jgi:hypothetical protein